jgi:hypothetical protein
MSWIGNMPRLTVALGIPMMSYDNCITSVACSSVTPSMSAWALSSSADKSCPSEECRPRYSSSASIASGTSRSISYRLRRIWHSSNVQSRSVSYLDLELDTCTKGKKSRWTTSARTQQASCSVCTSPSVHAKATNPSSHVTMTPSQLSSSLSRARSYPCSSTATACVGDRVLCQLISRS